jgi:hypothetical protein
MRAVVTELAPARASREIYIEAVSANHAIEATIVKDQSVRRGVAEGLRLFGKWLVTRKSDVPVSFQSLKPSNLEFFAV